MVKVNAASRLVLQLKTADKPAGRRSPNTGFAAPSAQDYTDLCTSSGWSEQTLLGSGYSGPINAKYSAGRGGGLGV